MPVIGALAGAVAGGGAIFGMPAGFLAAGGMVAVGSMVSKMMKFPGMPEMPETPAGRIQEVDAEVEGWANIMRRSQGVRGTMLTGPQLAQTDATTKRATLLSG